MPFSHHCGAETATGAAYCGSCGSATSISAAITTQIPTIAHEPRSPNTKSIKDALDNIAAKLGIEKIAGVSPKDFFSEILSRHEPDGVERLLSVGTPDTTPNLDVSMGVMPHAWIFFRIL